MHERGVINGLDLACSPEVAEDCQLTKGLPGAGLSNNYHSDKYSITYSTRMSKGGEKNSTLVATFLLHLSDSHPWLSLEIEDKNTELN